MPLDPALMGNLIFATGAGQGMLGEKFQPFANAVAKAVVNWLKTAIVNTVDVGLLGTAVGAGTGAINNSVPAPLEGLLLPQFAAQGMLGQFTPPMVKALATGIATNTATAIVQTQVPAFATGSGTGAVVPQPAAALEGLLLAELSAAQFLGEYTPKVAKAISLGCFAWAGTLLVATVDVGVPLIVPPGVTVPGSSAGIGALS